MLLTGKDLRWYRRNAALTQSALGQQAGTTGTYISVLEKSDELPPAMRARLAKVLQFYYDHPLLPSAPSDEVPPSAAPLPLLAPLPSLRPAIAPPLPPASISAGRNYQRLTPEQRAQNQARQKQEAERIRQMQLRNRLRDIARPQIQALQAELAPIAARLDWEAYRVALATAAAAAENHHVDAFIAAAQTRVVPSDDPLVTLPLEALP